MDPVPASGEADQSASGGGVVAPEPDLGDPETAAAVLLSSGIALLAVGIAGGIIYGLRLWQPVPKPTPGQRTEQGTEQRTEQKSEQKSSAQPPTAARADDGPAGRIELLNPRSSAGSTTLIACFLAFFLAFLGQQLGMLSAAALIVPQGETPTPEQAALAAICGYLGAVLTIGFACLFDAGLRRLLTRGWRPGRLAADTLRSTGALVVTYPFVFAASILGSAIAVWITGQSPDEVSHKTLEALMEGGSTLWFVLTIVGVAVGAPLVEEVLFRGLLQSGMRGIVGVWPAMLVTSALFTLIHLGSVEPRALPGLFALSMGLAILYERTGRLWPVILMHALFNGGNLAFALLVVAG